MDTNKQWKRVPFDIELAKKIQSGEVEGRLLMKPYKSEKTYPVVILTCDAVHNRKIKGLTDIVVLVQFEDGDVAMQFNSDGYGLDVHGNDVRLLIELPEETPKHEFKVGDKPSLVCPKCLKPFHNCRSWPAYHNTIEYECPHCGYIDDHVAFETIYSWHPYNKTEKHEFKPFDKVLVRSTNNGITSLWMPKFFSDIIIGSNGPTYFTTDDKCYSECIPYEGNEHLVGTTKNPE